MAKRLYTWLIGGLLLTSCMGVQQQREWLARADSLVSSSPDSAWRVLQQVSPRKLRDEGMRARFALVWTEACLRRGVPVRSDSLIRPAVDYYDGSGEVEMQARAHYWAGHVYRRLGEEEAALQHYLQAEHLARETENKRFRGLIYLNLAYLYVTQDLPERADSVYQLAGEVGRLLPDTGLWAESLCRRAVIAINKGKEHYAEAEDSLLLARELLRSNTNKQAQRILTDALSGLYARLRDGAKAVRFAKENLALQADTTTCYVAWALLGEAYYRSQQYDSAMHYLRKALPATNYFIKSDAYMRLADIYKKQGDADKALQMERKYSAYQDSILLQSRQSDGLLVAEQHFLRKLESRQADRNLRRIGWLLAGALVLAVGLFGCWRCQRSGWLRRKKQFELQEADAAKAQQELQEKLQQSHIRQDEQCSQIEAQQSQIFLLQDQVRLLRKQGPRNLEALQQEEFEHLPVYAKMKRIMEEHARYAQSEEKMTEEDWLQLEEAANRRWNCIGVKLRKYKLPPREIRFCCLLLAGFQGTHLVALLGKQRNFYYTMQTSIVKKRFAGSFSETSLKNILEKLVAEELV